MLSGRFISYLLTIGDNICFLGSFMDDDVVCLGTKHLNCSVQRREQVTWLQFTCIRKKLNPIVTVPTSEKKVNNAFIVMDLAKTLLLSLHVCFFLLSLCPPPSYSLRFRSVQFSSSQFKGECTLTSAQEAPICVHSRVPDVSPQMLPLW